MVGPLLRNGAGRSTICGHSTVIATTPPNPLSLHPAPGNRAYRFGSRNELELPLPSPS
jgi:hypothetical protein